MSMRVSLGNPVKIYTNENKILISKHCTSQEEENAFIKFALAPNSTVAIETNLLNHHDVIKTLPEINWILIKKTKNGFEILK